MSKWLLLSQKHVSEVPGELPNCIADSPTPQGRYQIHGGKGKPQKSPEWFSHPSPPSLPFFPGWSKCSRFLHQGLTSLEWRPQFCNNNLLVHTSGQERCTIRHDIYLLAIVSDRWQNSPQRLEAHCNVQQMSGEEEVVVVAQDGHGCIPGKVEKGLWRKDGEVSQQPSRHSCLLMGPLNHFFPGYWGAEVLWLA